MKLSNFCKIAIISACWSVFFSYIPQFQSLFGSVFLYCGEKDIPYGLYQTVGLWSMLIPLIAITIVFRVGKKESLLLDNFFESSISALGLCIVLFYVLSSWTMIHPCESNSNAWILTILISWGKSVPFVVIAFGIWWIFSRKNP